VIEFHTASTAPPAGDASRLAAHLFRREAGRLVSVLTRAFGVERLDLAEDVVQETLVRALQTWPYYGVPDNPVAWMTTTARNLALDVLRRESYFRKRRREIADFLEQWSARAECHPAAESGSLDDEIEDARLRMMFTCCHPLVPADAQAALALKTLCGFGVGEIASAFLSTEAAVAKRLTRARQKIRELRVPFEIPDGEELTSRVDGVLQTLYLLFNEGYKASHGDSLIREELCHEAIRLAALLAAHPAGDQPRTHALLSLMLLNASRLPARQDDAGNILLLRHQDRSRWDGAMIARGMMHFARSAAGDDLSEYHLHAGVSAVHCAASDDASTDWPRILSLYDRWAQINGSPVVALNRAVAVANVHGPRAGIEAVESIADRQTLESYYLLYAVLADFEAQLGNFAAAAAHLRRALQLTGLRSEQALLSERLRECEAHVRTPA
jgi:RNA polymerase sigma-70 factor (ECF subfamily)